MPSITELRAGDPTSLGGYGIRGRLGEGGQGVVYLGVNDQGGRAAIKWLRPHLAGDEVAAERFAREAEAARRVAPFCTAQVLGTGVHERRPFIASEYVDGPSLARAVAETGPRAGPALHRLAVGTATALAAIHQAGIVHRDFGPANVILGGEGPRVIDFGIARALDATSTITSMPVGTPAFMAPEQILAQPAGPAADLFAWGGTMVFAAGGAGPFEAETVPAIIQRVLHAEPDLSRLTGTLRELVAACLTKDPGRRPTAEQVILRLLEQPVTDPRLLDQATTVIGPLTRPPAQPARPPWPPSTSGPHPAAPPPGSPLAASPPGPYQSGGSPQSAPPQGPYQPAASPRGTPPPGPPRSEGAPVGVRPPQPATALPPPTGRPADLPPPGHQPHGMHVPATPAPGTPSPVTPSPGTPVFGPPRQGMNPPPWTQARAPKGGRGWMIGAGVAAVALLAAIAVVAVTAVNLRIGGRPGPSAQAGATTTATPSRAGATTTATPSRAPSPVPTTNLTPVELPSTAATIYENPADPIRLTTYLARDAKSGEWVYHARDSLAGPFTGYKNTWESVLSPDGRYLAQRGKRFVDGYDTVEITDKVTAQRFTVRTSRQPLSAYVQVWSRDSRRLLVNVGNPAKDAWQSTGFAIVDVTTRQAGVASLREGSLKGIRYGFDGDDTGVVALSNVAEQQALRFFDASGVRVRRLPNVGAGIADALFSPSGERFVTDCPGLRSGNNCVYDARTGAEVRRVESPCAGLATWYDDDHLVCWVRPDGTADHQQLQVIDFTGTTVRLMADVPRDATDLDVMYTFTRN
ncbi:protein kinase [Nonomuraea sp. NPDC048892]|uniref:serine/threonine protein kinase n=1 Tax=Nonomuraea sp. NPDC048892 TaxID=3154624 RepID=UPI0033F67314